MNIIFLLGLNVLGHFACVVHGAVTYGSPFDSYGNGNQIKPRFPEALVTYGPVQRSETAPQAPSYYPASQQRQRPYYPAQGRQYNVPGGTRSFEPAQQRTYAQPQPRAYLYGQARPVTAQAQQRSYPSTRRRPYVPVKPQVYPQTPQIYPAYPQQRAYTHPPFGQRTSTAYFAPAAQNVFSPVARQSIGTLERQPIAPILSQPMNTGLNQEVHPMSRGIAQPVNAFARQSINPIRSQPNNAFVQQAIKGPQAPVARTFALRPPTMYRPVINPMAQLPQGISPRPVVPLGLGMNGRNSIPKTPGRNTVPGRTISSEINGPIPPYPSNKRNSIVFNPKPNSQAPEKTQAVRNYINGISIQQTVADKSPVNPQVNRYPDPSKSLAIPIKSLANPNPSSSRSPIAPVKSDVDPGHVVGKSINKPIRPQINPNLLATQSLNTPINPYLSRNSPTDHRLSSFLRSVKNLNDTLNENTMKQGLIYYDDDVNNKTIHQPTNFAPPTRKLGSMGSPGGSRVTFTNDPIVRPAIIPETKAITQPGSERVTIAQADKNVAKNETIEQADKNVAKNVTIEQADKNVAKNVEIAHANINVANNVALAGNISRQNETENIARPQTPQTKRTIVPGKAGAKHIEVKNSLEIPSVERRNTTNVASPRAKKTLDLAKATAAQVDLGRLKEKVLHSNNSKFLKRVLQVLRKYTKLMKSSMVGKNETKNVVLNASIVESNSEKDNITKVENLKVIKANETAISDSGMEFAGALNSTKAAVDIFDKLNNASRENLNSSVVEEKANEPESKDSTFSKDNSKKSCNGTASDIMSSNSEKGHSLNENASKKGKIETEKSLGKHVFNLDKLKYGLERGNTID